MHPNPIPILVARSLLEQRPSDISCSNFLASTAPQDISADELNHMALKI